jgi:hypothetical protein
MFMLNDGPFDVSADISHGGESLGKWLIAHEPKAWHHVCCDSLFKFHDSCGMRHPTCR